MLVSKFMYCLFICLCSAFLLLMSFTVHTLNTHTLPVLCEAEFLFFAAVSHANLYTLPAAIINIPKNISGFSAFCLLYALSAAAAPPSPAPFLQIPPESCRLLYLLPCRLVTCRHHYRTYQNYLYKKYISFIRPAILVQKKKNKEKYV